MSQMDTINFSERLNLSDPFASKEKSAGRRSSFLGYFDKYMSSQMQRHNYEEPKEIGTPMSSGSSRSSLSHHDEALPPIRRSTPWTHTTSSIGTAISDEFNLGSFPVSDFFYFFLLVDKN